MFNIWTNFFRYSYVQTLVSRDVRLGSGFYSTEEPFYDQDS